MLKLLSWLFVAGKLGKVLLTGGSMILSMVIYSFVFGWRYAVGFVLLIFVHEMGHYVAARQRHLAVGAPTFIPFVGAWIAMKEMPRNVDTEAYVGFAGPIAGSLAALGCYWVARHFDAKWLLALSYSGFMINLFNLIPLSPLDGGRITAIISPRVWLLGVPLLAALFFFRPSPMLILIAVLAFPHLRASLSKKTVDASVPQGYYDVPLGSRVNYAVMYLGLVAFLAVMSHELHGMLS